MPWTSSIFCRNRGRTYTHASKPAGLEKHIRTQKAYIRRLERAIDALHTGEKDGDEVLAQLWDPLAIAERLLAAMLVEETIYISDLPLPHRMPLRPNPHFVGREEDLQALALKGGGSVAVGQVAAGRLAVI